MDCIERSIHATLAYYGALQRPLTLVELFQRLIPMRRFGQQESPPSLGALASRMDALITTAAVKTEYGLYSSGDVLGGFGERFVRRQKESAQKFQRMLKYAWWLQAVPYVRTIAASGSLALNNCNADSDWDSFVIAKNGRLYTARAGLLFVAFLMGRLRTKRMRTAPDTFCFNHFLTTDGLSFRHRSIFTAHACTWLTPVYDPDGTLGKFRQANIWISDYSSRTGDSSFVRRSVRYSGTANAVRLALEFFLDSFVGSSIERGLRRWMQRRISAEPVTRAAGGRIIADDREIEFHPHSFEAVALARYNNVLTKLGLSRFHEKDSGLQC